jgi:hypothetical protein
MKKLSLFLMMLSFLNCQKEDERCGQIIQKVAQNAVYYFVLQTDENIRSYGDQNLPSIPDDGVRQGSVSKEVYESLKSVTNTVPKAKNLLFQHL